MRHKSVAVAAGECRHTRRLGIQLMFKKNRQIFLGHFAECNSHLIRPNEMKLSRRANHPKRATPKSAGQGRLAVGCSAWLGLTYSSWFGFWRFRVLELVMLL